MGALSRIDVANTAAARAGGFRFFGQQQRTKHWTTVGPTITKRLAQPPLVARHQNESLKSDVCSFPAAGLRKTKDAFWVMISVGGFNDIEFHC
jgi:formylmethanofuran dehydrogenase subunit A